MKKKKIFSVKTSAGLIFFGEFKLRERSNGSVLELEKRGNNALFYKVTTKSGYEYYEIFWFVIPDMSKECTNEGIFGANQDVLIKIFTFEDPTDAYYFFDFVLETESYDLSDYCSFKFKMQKFVKDHPNEHTVAKIMAT